MGYHAANERETGSTMKKNNAKLSEIGRKRTAKNKARKARAKVLQEFNQKTFEVKVFQEYLKQQQGGE